MFNSAKDDLIYLFLQALLSMFAPLLWMILQGLLQVGFDGVIHRIFPGDHRLYPCHSQIIVDAATHTAGQDQITIFEGL